MRNLKYIPLVLFLLPASGLYSEKIVFSQTGIFYLTVSPRTTILGQIKNPDKYTSIPHIIRLKVDDITIDEQHSFETKINRDGSFRFNIPLYHSINAYLLYGDGQTNIYLFPNDTLKLICDIGRMKYGTDLINFKYDERHSGFEIQFSKQIQWYSGKLCHFRAQLQPELSPVELKSKYLAFLDTLSEQIHSRVLRDTLNPLLAHFLIFSAKYSVYGSIILCSENIKDQEEFHSYISFLTDTVIYNQKAMLTSEYKFFMNYYRHLIEDRNFEKTSGPQAAIDERCSDTSMKELITNRVNNCFKRRSGIWAEFLAASFFIAFFDHIEELSLSSIEYSREIISNTFTDSYIRLLLLEISDESKSNVKRINDKPISKEVSLTKNDSISGEQFWNELLEKNKGSVIYIDVWATWCGPCKAEMPFSMQLYDMYKQKPVSFVFLCGGDSDEAAWKKVIQQYQLKGRQYLLNKIQYKYLCSKFYIKSIPRYILVSKSGKIINANASRPGTEEILVNLDELLKEK